MSKVLRIFALLLLTMALCAANALAHRLNIFAWLNNDQVIVECDNGQHSPAIGANVDIRDSVTGRSLASGKTGDNGRYSFTVPDVIRQGHGLIIEVNAGQGHRGEWKMDASELYSAAALTAGFDEARLQEDGHVHLNATPANPASTAPLPGANPQPDIEAIRSVVQQSLEAGLAPIRRELAARNSAGPGMTEILGGLGWLIGLVGIALYFKSRRKDA